MKFLELQAAIGAAVILFSSPSAARKHAHVHNVENLSHKRHNHLHVGHTKDNVKRGSCTFPANAGLVSVTPNEQNAGWAMSPDQPCLPGHYCPYACPSGEVMAQWNPSATSYVYPLSMDGGLYCNSNGQISKPFPSKPYCVKGTNTLGAQNLCTGTVSFCQTVLPGNEAMLIPTAVDKWSQLAVPDISYWASTAAHYYINAPGIGIKDACLWSDGSKPLGNWSPYVAGANTDANGNTFAKIGWNPIFTNSALKNTPPTFGVKIECSGSGCNGEPCSIDPTIDGVGGVTSSDQAAGAGGANFCVVTIPKGETANVVVFHVGDSEGGSGYPVSPTPTPTPTPTPAPTPTTTSTTSTSTSTSTTSTTSSSSTESSSIPKPSSTTDGEPHVLFQQVNSTSSSILATGTGGTGGTAPSAHTTKNPAPTQSTAPNSGSGNMASTGAVIFTFAIAAAVALI